MERLSRGLTITLLVSALACGAEDRGATGTAGKPGRSASSSVAGYGGNAGPRSAGSGGNGNSSAPAQGGSGGSASMGGDSTGTASSGGARDIGGGTGSSSTGGAAGGKTESGQAGTGGGGKAGASGGKATTGGTTGTATTLAVGGTGGTSSASGGSTGAGPKCTTCHGDSTTDNPAPPADTEGNADTSSPGVGAHDRHLGTSTWHRKGQCADCHTLPTSTTHANGKVDFTWGAPSNADGAKPSFDATSLTCAGAYCHGTTLPGASSGKTTPVWNQVNGTWNACGTCHGTPPAASTGHPDSAACEKCHGKVIASFEGTSAQTTWKDASLHINGTIDVDTLTCTSCHGSGNNPAPPKDTQGGAATSAPGVGAHAQHLGTSTWHRQGQCADCHATPASTSHANNTVDFAWGATSKASGATPSFNGGDLSCSGTYCHGSKMADQSTSVGHAPIWNKVDGTHDACGKACHANPPSGGSHTATSTACQNCHGDVITLYNGANSTWKDASLHINGKVEATALTCTSCHGSGTNPAPPKDTQGGTATSAAGVGAHAQHLGTATWHRQGQCADCHATPASMSHANNTVDFTWGAISKASGASPSFNATGLSCSGTYCHGSKMADQSTSVGHAPIWNKVDGTHDACGKACHANPPSGGSHTATSTACQNCHGDVITLYNGANSTWKDASLHINGKVEATALTCTSCHGSGTNPAPPKDTQGGTATSAAGVGAHAQHLGTATWHRQGQCADCHATPASMSHANNTVDFTWGAISKASGASPSFNATGLSCSGTYCHGSKMADQSTSVGHAPIWNKVDGTHDACGKACHANPPNSGSHTATSTACQSCHGDVIASYAGASSTWKNASLHINGKVEASAQACDACHGNPPNSGTHRRREHQVSCTYCHPDPSGSTHRNGRVDQSCGSNRAGCHDQGD